MYSKYNPIKKCPFCGKKHNNKVYCSQKCHWDAIGRKLFVKCNYCGKSTKVKKTNKFKRHFCDKNCYYDDRRKDVVPFKNKIIQDFNNGKMLMKIAEELGVEYKRFYSYTKNWGLEKRKPQHYQIISILLKKGKEIDFEKLYKEKKMSYHRAHFWASRVWKITQKPCEVCGWDKESRDMHLIIPRLLKKENAISTCPNCHRLITQKKMEILRDKNKQILIKKI